MNNSHRLYSLLVDCLIWHLVKLAGYCGKYCSFILIIPNFLLSLQSWGKKSSAISRMKWKKQLLTNYRKYCTDCSLCNKWFLRVFWIDRGSYKVWDKAARRLNKDRTRQLWERKKSPLYLPSFFRPLRHRFLVGPPVHTNEKHTKKAYLYSVLLWPLFKDR